MFVTLCSSDSLCRGCISCVVLCCVVLLRYGVVLCCVMFVLVFVFVFVLCCAVLCCVVLWCGVCVCVVVCCVVFALWCVVLCCVVLCCVVLCLCLCCVSTRIPNIHSFTQKRFVHDIYYHKFLSWFRNDINGLLWLCVYACV